MDIKVRWATPLCSVVVIASFLMSFVSLKTHDKELSRETGIDIIKGSSDTGLEIPVGEAVSPNVVIRLPGKNLFALAALIIAIAQLILFLLMKQHHEMFYSFIGFAGGLSLLIMRIQLDSSLEHVIEAVNSPISLHVDYLWGYWLALLFFLAAGAVNLFAFIEQQQQAINKTE